MGTQWSQIVREESKHNPGIADYTRCQSAVFAYSSLSMVAVTGLTFGVLQHKTFKPISMKTKCLLSGLCGAATSWYIAAVRTKFCQELWKMLDEKQKQELVNTLKNRRLRQKDD